MRVLQRRDVMWRAFQLLSAAVLLPGGVSLVRAAESSSGEPTPPETAAKPKTPASACTDPNESAEVASLRASLHYTDAAADSARSCHVCAFFAAAEKDTACGRCLVFEGPVSPTGHCDSWSHKE